MQSFLRLKLSIFYSINRKNATRILQSCIFYVLHDSPPSLLAFLCNLEELPETGDFSREKPGFLFVISRKVWYTESSCSGEGKYVSPR